ncbi:hypothetical protein ABT324_28175 [Saccharopolyspora sp. NPDC000359]|uniref:hypothetical protein n=1 Tax=Saccharopolyspora sp. NPDC000359 TaxID=3154251 RepID=UPI0033295BC0
MPETISGEHYERSAVKSIEHVLRGEVHALVEKPSWFRRATKDSAERLARVQDAQEAVVAHRPRFSATRPRPASQF